MKKITIFAIGLSAMAFTIAIAASRSSTPYFGSRPAEVWEIVQENPYEGELPVYKVTVGSFFSGLTNRLQQAATRTLSERADILPPFKKLLHANGICFAGTWNITESNPYSGYFKQGSEGRIIIRASAALSETKQGEKRSFGIAGKLFPTSDAEDPRLLPTANFFVIDNLAGSFLPNFRDTVLSNDITAIENVGISNLPNAGVGLAAAQALSAAEKAVSGGDATIRQVYEIAELGTVPGERIITPQWLKLSARTGSREEAEDFRDELRLDNNNGELVFDITVTSDGKKGQEKKNWQTIGNITLTEDSISKGCDTRLHFAHPTWRNDLNFKP